jgi:hypothetical protein
MFQLSPPDVSTRRKVELRARNVREFCLNADFHVTFRNLSHAVKLRHGTDGFTSPPTEGVLRIFFALKIRRLRPGANPRPWVPTANTLPLDHRSRYLLGYSFPNPFGLWASQFWFQKISTDPNILSHMSIVCRDDGYPK